MGFILPKQAAGGITNSAPSGFAGISNGTNIVDGTTLPSVSIANPTAINIDSQGGTTIIGDANDEVNNTTVKVDDSTQKVLVNGTLDIGGASILLNGSTAIFLTDVSFGGGVEPTTAASAQIGSANKPFSSNFIGNAANHSNQVTSLATANRVNPMPDADGTVLIDTLFNLSKTITPGGTTGAQTINKYSGSVNFAAAATSLVVTNSLISASSVITCTIGTNDTTMKSVLCVAGSGSFTIFPNAAPTAETRVNFRINN